MLGARPDDVPRPGRPNVCGVTGDREVGALFLLNEGILLELIELTWGIVFAKG